MNQDRMSHALVNTAPITIGESVYLWNGRRYELVSGPDVLRQADEYPRDGYAHCDFLERANAWDHGEWGYGNA